MKKLIVLVGLPRSGKSTWAREQGFPIVNRDSIRLAHHGQAFIQEAENFITIIEDIMVKSLFEAGAKTVVVDACHTSQRYRNKWQSMMKPLGIVVELKYFKTPKEECIQRAIDTEQEYLIPVIERMHKNWVKEIGDIPW